MRPLGLCLLALSVAVIPGCSEQSATPAATEKQSAAPITFAVVNARIWAGDAGPPRAASPPANGGEIGAPSQVDRGSRFEVRLPLA